MALALAGGGPLGATFEIGALCALADALDGLDLNGCDHYVGVSAGGFVAAALANGITPRALCAAFIEGQGDDAQGFEPNDLMQPAYAEMARRAASVPGLMLGATWDLLQGKPLSRALERLGMPTRQQTQALDMLHQAAYLQLRAAALEPVRHFMREAGQRLTVERERAAKATENRFQRLLTR